MSLRIAYEEPLAALGGRDHPDCRTALVGDLVQRNVAGNQLIQLLRAYGQHSG